MTRSPADQKTQIEKVITPVIEGAGYELADLEFRRESGTWILRLYIDKAGALVGLDDCSTVSREVSATLDVHDVIHQHYTLEVSSPGLDRPLRKPEHFRRFVGQRISMSLKLGLVDIGRRNFTGLVLGVSDDGTTVSLQTDDGKRFELPLADLDKAQLKPDFSALSAKRVGE
jgi:ribosome maturation factor RimP